MNRLAKVLTVTGIMLTTSLIGGYYIQHNYYPTDTQMAEHVHDLCLEWGDGKCEPLGRTKQAFAAGEMDCVNTDDNMLEADRPFRRAVMAADSLTEVVSAVRAWKQRQIVDEYGPHPICRPGNRLGLRVK